MVWSVKYHLFCENRSEAPYKYAVFFEVYIAAAFIFNALWLQFLVDYYAIYSTFYLCINRQLANSRKRNEDINIDFMEHSVP